MTVPLVANILSNNMDKDTLRGQVIMEISDHLPIFAIYNFHIEKMNGNKYKRERGNGKAYDTFQYLFISLYDNNPVKQCRTKQNYIHKARITQ